MVRYRHIMVLVAVVFQAVAMAVPTVEELLDRCAETLDKTHTSFITQSKIQIRDYVMHRTPEAALMNGERDKFLTKEFRTDGNRMKMITQLWGGSLGPENRDTHSENEKQYSSHTFDGERRYDHNRPYDGAGSVSISDNFKKKNPNFLDIEFAYGDPTSQSFGYLIGDVERFDRILKEAKPEQMSVKKEELNGTVHYLIDAKTNNGRYRIWLNPERGYNFSRAIVVREEGDTHFGRYKVEPGTSKRSVVENTEFKKVDDLWVPVKTKSKMNDTLSNGGHMKSDFEIELNSIVINPDHDALDSFSTDDIKDGAKARIRGIRINYIWSNGELVPDIDQVAIDQLDKMTEEILAERKMRKAASEKAVANDSITLAKILAEYAKSQKQIASFYCVSSTAVKEQKAVLSRYACEGSRFSVKVKAGAQGINDFVWDGRHSIHSSVDSGRSKKVLASADNKKPYQLLATVYPGAALLGYLNGQPQRIDTMLSKVSKEVTVTEEKLNRKSCYVVNAVIGKDTYRVWFLPANGYHIAKAEVKTNSRVVYLLDQVRLKKVEDNWVPMSCAIKDSTRQYTYKRTKVDLKPDFEKLKAFDLPISNGTPVTIEKQPGKFIWRNGHIVDKEGKDVL